ncbi:hypothetical protein HDV01_006873 [Terramyces sp. JEL0728]|nr:hypothetical protein HDV01_006873 [Terramyces sp. JEL0728]
MAAVLSAVWYGGSAGNSDGIRLSNVTADPHVGPFNYTFSFIQEYCQSNNSVGSWASYNDFNQFRLFEVTTQSLIATADLPSSRSSDVQTTTAKSEEMAPKSLLFPVSCLLAYSFEYT